MKKETRGRLLSEKHKIYAKTVKILDKLGKYRIVKKICVFLKVLGKAKKNIDLI